MKHRIYLIAIFIFSFIEFLSAQPRCYFEHYGTENGLPQNTINYIIQDKKGFLWMSTWAGLCKFDGYNFFSYQLDSQDANMVRSSRIDYIGEDNYGYIWAIPNDGEVQRFDPRTEKFTGLNIFKEFRGRNLSTHEVINTPSGKVWLIFESGGCVCVTDSLFHIRFYSNENKKIVANTVNIVFEDKERNSWIMSNNGLYKVNEGNKIESFYKGNIKIPGNKFYSCIESENEIWFGTGSGLIRIYNKKRKRFDGFFSGIDSPILFIKRINNSQILMASADKGFSIYNTANHELSCYSSINLPQMSNNRILSCYVDRAENVWFEMDCIGVFKFNPLNRQMKHFEMKVEKENANIFPPNFFIFEDNFNRLWVHPHGGGFSYYDPVLDQLMPFYNEPFSSNWRFSNMMHAAFSDKQGNLWLSTRSRGLEKIVFMTDIFKTTFVDSKIHSSVNNDIKAIYEDHTKKLWVSSKGGKVYLYINGKQLGYLCKDGSVSNVGKPIDGFCYCIMEDNNNNLWLGTKGDGIYKLKSIGSFKYQITQFKNNPSNKYSLSSNNIYSLYQDKRGRIWIGTYGGGLNLMDEKQENRFYNINNEMKQYPNTSGAKIRIISADKFGNICLGTTLGLIVFPFNFHNPSSIQFHLYTSQSPKNSGIKANDVYDICTTRKGETYFAIFGGGVSKIKQTDKNGLPISFETIDKNSGLPSDITMSLQVDLDGKLWIATEGNLTSYNPANKSFVTYSEASRLISGYSFSECSRFSSSNGTVYFGFSNGFLSVRTDQITENTYTPYIALSQFRIDNKIVSIGGKNSPLKQAIDGLKTLELNYKQNSFTIEFAALDYVNPNNISYAYKLDGVDKDWITSKQHQVSYAKVAAGKYVFHIKSTNSDGIWVNNERTLTIVVHPPFWASNIAYCLYFIIFCATLYFAIRTIFTFYRLQDKIKLEQEQTEMRTRFFTDISHEIRTPLTMIVSPIENIVEDKNTPFSIKEQLQLVSKNANRMLRMVNQILDFRKIQKQVMRVQETKIGMFVSDVCSNLVEPAAEKNISLSISNQVGDDVLWIDREGIEKLLFNLVSNAIKYTPSGKSIYVNVFNKDNQIALSVTDEGKGMTKDIQNKMFTRFVTFNNDKSKPSTGIGLSIVKEVADKHKAKILVSSEEGKGSSFTILFIKGFNHFDSETTLVQNMETVSVSIPLETEVEDERNEEKTEKRREAKQSILIVEDDSDLKSFIKSSLSEFYKIYEANDGKEGYEVASKKYPDFILSDVMMPNIDGFELLQMVRQNKNISHIPFILLTAKTDIESKLEGLMFGADDYITKPFSVKYLRARIDNIMQMRHNLFNSYDNERTSPDSDSSKQNSVSKTKSLIITPHDEDFVKQVKEIIIANIDNSSFVVEDLANEMSMSRTVFFKKLKSLTGFAPIEFIRDIKIRKAAEIMLKEDYSIKEIAFMIGFSDTKYFTQCFKQVFECTPSEYRKQK